MIGTQFLIVIIGMFAILWLGHLVLIHSYRVGVRFGLSQGFVGLSILSIGTSFPEIFSHILGSYEILQNHQQMKLFSGLVLGTSIGSDIFQQMIILPIVALLGSISINKEELGRGPGALVLAALLIWVLCLNGELSRLEGAVMLGAYVWYLVHLYRLGHSPNDLLDHEDELRKFSAFGSFLILLVSFSAMAVTAHYVLTASKVVIESFHLSSAFFGILVLGTISALPELTTSILSIRRGQSEISAGILIGSNITNPLFAAGLGALVSTYSVPYSTNFVDLPVKITSGLILYAVFWKDQKLKTFPALILIFLFCLYLSIRNTYFPLFLE